MFYFVCIELGILYLVREMVGLKYCCYFSRFWSVCRSFFYGRGNDFFFFFWSMFFFFDLRMIGVLFCLVWVINRFFCCLVCRNNAFCVRVNRRIVFIFFIEGGGNMEVGVIVLGDVDIFFVLFFIWCAGLLVMFFFCFCFDSSIFNKY